MLWLSVQNLFIVLYRRIFIATVLLNSFSKAKMSGNRIGIYIQCMPEVFCGSFPFA